YPPVPVPVGFPAGMRSVGSGTSPERSPPLSGGTVRHRRLPLPPAIAARCVLAVAVAATAVDRARGPAVLRPRQPDCRGTCSVRAADPRFPDHVAVVAASAAAV